LLNSLGIIRYTKGSKNDDNKGTDVVTDSGFVVDIGAFINEQLSNVGVAVVCGDVQRCKSALQHTT